MIPPGKLRSASQSCVACFRRTSPDDLILLDDKGKVIEQEAPKQAVSQEPENPAYRSMWEDEPDANQTEKTHSVGTGEPNIESVLTALYHASKKVMDEQKMRAAQDRGVFSFESQSVFDDSLPEPEPWDRIALPQGARWVSQYGIPMLVFKEKSTKFLLIFGCCWSAVTLSVILVLFLDIQRNMSSLDDILDYIYLLLFGGILLFVGGLMTYFGVRYAFSKTWLDLSKSVIMIEHGLSRKGKQISVPRDPQKVKVVASVNSIENSEKRYKIEYVWGNERAVLASNAKRNSALEIFNFAKALLVAIV